MFMNSHQGHLRRQLAELLPQLRRYASSLTTNDDISEDLVQASLQREISNSIRRVPTQFLKTLLFETIRKMWSAEVRRRSSNRANIDHQSDNALETVDGCHLAETNIMLALARSNFAKLPECQRTAMTLVVIEGESYQDAARHLGIPVGTLMSRLARGREAMRFMMEELSAPNTVTQMETESTALPHHSWRVLDT
jgi:RNA polymerase sigma-70 factor (ECF subfamily)